jgi:BirA family biotin operon repressor/biotin-[acetyl-CoA-carboxylase] ligase
MNKVSLKDGLQTRVFAQNLIFYEVTNSTNTQAKEMLKRRMLPEGTVLVAARQTAGRGTGGHRWESATPESLLFSLILQTPLRQQPLSFVPAIALARTLRAYYDIDAHLKWPNDVLVGDGKLAGILCEGVSQPNLETAWVVGVGVNVNQQVFPEPIRDIAISMHNVTGMSYSIENVFQHYLFEMEQLYHSPQDLIGAWLRYTRMMGQTIRATRHDQETIVKMVGLSLEGYLQVEHADGQCETWMSATDRDIARSY